MQFFVLLAPLALMACVADRSAVDLSNVRACSGLEFPTGEANPGECKIEGGDATLHITYGDAATAGEAGTVRVDVLNDRGGVAQTFSENVSEFLPVSTEDIDGDGRLDILVGLYSGNVNTAHGVWLYNGEQGAYRRAGEISGVEYSRTSEGYLAVAARSSAASWNVAFYRVASEFEPLVTINVTAVDVTEDGRVLRSECTIEEAPGLASLNLSEGAARAKFCAEPQAGVFGP
jgi:hypothetical protein